MDAARTRAQELLVAEAARLGSLSVIVTEPGGALQLTVTPDGAIAQVGGSIPHVQTVPAPGVITLEAITDPDPSTVAVVPDPPFRVEGLEQPPIDHSRGDGDVRCAENDEAEAAEQQDLVDEVHDPGRGVASVLLDALLTERRCSVCGCSQEQECPGGCWWVAEDLCSRCQIAAEVAAGEVEPAVADPTGRLHPVQRRCLRRRAVTGAAVAVVAAGVSAWALTQPAGDDAGAAAVVHSVPAASAAQVEQWAADLQDAQWAAQRRAVADRGAARAHLDRLASAAGVLVEARSTLDGCPNAGEAQRAALSALVDQLSAQLDAGAGPYLWLGLLDQFPGAQQEVVQSQAAWQADEDARAAVPDPEPAVDPGTGSSQGGGGSSPKKQTPAAAPAPQAGGAGAGSAGQSSHKEINPGTISWGSGWVRASAEAIGVTGPVYLNIAGRSVLMGTGSGTFEVLVEDLPAGTYSWSVSADGMVAAGSKSVVVG